MGLTRIFTGLAVLTANQIKELQAKIPLFNASNQNDTSVSNKLGKLHNLTSQPLTQHSGFTAISSLSELSAAIPTHSLNVLKAFFNLTTNEETFKELRLAAANNLSQEFVEQYIDTIITALETGELNPVPFMNYGDLVEGRHEISFDKVRIPNYRIDEAIAIIQNDKNWRGNSLIINKLYNLFATHATTHVKHTNLKIFSAEQLQVLAEYIHQYPHVLVTFGEPDSALVKCLQAIFSQSRDPAIFTSDALDQLYTKMWTADGKIKFEYYVLSQLIYREKLKNRPHFNMDPITLINLNHYQIQAIHQKRENWFNPKPDGKHPTLFQQVEIADESYLIKREVPYLCGAWSGQKHTLKTQKVGYYNSAPTYTRDSGYIPLWIDAEKVTKPNQHSLIGQSVDGSFTINHNIVVSSSARAKYSSEL
jgi:hypothetical protein